MEIRDSNAIHDSVIFYVEAWNEDWKIWTEEFCRLTGLTLDQALLFRLLNFYGHADAAAQKQQQRVERIWEYVERELDDGDAWKEDSN